MKKYLISTLVCMSVATCGMAFSRQDAYRLQETLLDGLSAQNRNVEFRIENTPRGITIDRDIQSIVTPQAHYGGFRKHVSVVTLPNVFDIAVRAADSEVSDDVPMVTPRVVYHASKDGDAPYDVYLNGLVMFYPVDFTQESVLGMAFVFNPETESDAFYPIAAGEYYVTTVASLYEDDLAVGLMGLCYKVELTEDGQLVELNYDDAKNKLQINCLDPQGKPFPEMVSEEDDYQTIGLVSMMLPGTSMTEVLIGYSEFFGLCNDIDTDRASYTFGITHLDKNQNTSLCYDIAVGPFLESLDKTVDVSNYRPMSSSFSLSETEKQSSYGGTSVRTEVSTVYGGSASDFAYADAGKIYSTCKVNALIPESTLFERSGDIQAGVVLGVDFLNDIETDIPTVKTSGYLSEIDGALLSYPVDTYNVNGVISHQNFPEIMFVTPPDEYFTKALIGVGSIRPSISWEDGTTLEGLEVAYGLTGQYNERLTTGVLPCVREVRVDGKVDNVAGKQIAEGMKFEVDLEYTDLLINNEIPATNQLTVTYTYSSERYYFGVPAPCFLQIRNIDGDVANEMSAEELGTIYLGVDGPDVWGMFAELSVCAEDDDQWQLLTPCEENRDYISMPLLCSYDLKTVGLKEGSWYKLKIKGGTDYGCYTEQTIDHSFYVKPSSSVSRIDTDQEVDGDYYNLQGIKVAQPSTGIYIKKSGLTTEKVVR